MGKCEIELGKLDAQKYNFAEDATNNFEYIQELCISNPGLIQNPEAYYASEL